MTDDGYARGVDEQAGFYSFGFGEGSKRVVASIVIPAGRTDGGQAFRELGKQVGNFRIFPKFGFGGGVDLEVVGEEGAGPGREIRKEPDAWTQEVHRFGQPVAARAAGPLLFP